MRELSFNINIKSNKMKKLKIGIIFIAVCLLCIYVAMQLNETEKPFNWVSDHSLNQVDSVTFRYDVIFWDSTHTVVKCSFTDTVTDEQIDSVFTGFESKAKEVFELIDR